MASIERHGNKFRVIWRENGVKRRRAFDPEDEARAVANNPIATAGLGSIDISPVVSAMLGRHRASPTVIEFARPLVEDPDLGAGSRDIYRSALRKVEGTVLGDTPLNKVTPSDVRQFMNALKSDRRNVHQFLGKVFNAAVNEGIIAGSPLAKGKIRRPPQLQKDLRPLSVEEVNQLMTATLNQREALCIKIGASVGLRAGEVGGLRAEDIDVKAGKIHVRRTPLSRARAGLSVRQRRSRVAVRRRSHGRSWRRSPTTSRTIHPGRTGSSSAPSGEGS